MSTGEAPSEIFEVHRPGELFPSFFGDPVIITAAKVLLRAQVGEYFILYKDQGNPALTRGKVSISVSEIAPEILPWTLAHTLEETYQIALRGYREYIEKKYPQTQQLPLLQAPYHFVDAGKEHLARLWMRDQYRDQMLEIQQGCQFQALTNYLFELLHLPVVMVAK